MIEKLHQEIKMDARICPKCNRSSLKIATMETNIFIIDEYGSPNNFDNYINGVLYCNKCDFSQEIQFINGRVAVPSESDGYIYPIEKNPYDDVKEITFKGNPFTGEGGN